jgi:hypothetical protein
MAVGDVKSLSQAREIIRNSFEVKLYQPREPQGWDEAYKRYRDVLGE